MFGFIIHKLSLTFGFATLDTDVHELKPLGFLTALFDFVLYSFLPYYLGSLDLHLAIVS
jgi:hypothetical protein